MASEASASVTAVASSGNIEVFSWLKTLPVAPEYHPTLAEFQDPIAYIYKIEKEASQYGICKIVPPVPPPPKKTAIVNLNKSLLARSGSSPTFTTRQQQIGFCPRKHRPVQKPVWQSGENYTVEQFEVKAKGFEKNYVKKSYKKSLTPLEIETLYWKATVDKPFAVEYANDMPGSAFAPKKTAKDGGGEGKNTISNNNSVTVGETEWNMRGVSRSKGSLLRFMKEEIPGVTSPMVYIAMMFSWFAWHVEDHDLHSLNYLHMGAGKTWYGVPRDAAVAFEEVIRVHGYAGEINPLVTFATLGEKTTVMSPEVLIEAGVPCCRLVQNAGEFVVTFPRAYHSGFSHGFNCGEAANIATPEWLKVAKDAAIRRASINCPPMVSHFQLLYDLALSFCSRVPKSIRLEPRSSRLKDKKKGEGEMLVKDLFVQDVMQNNNLLHMLADGSSVVILPQNTLDSSFSSNLKDGLQLESQTRRISSLGSPDLMLKIAKSLVSEDAVPQGKEGVQQGTGTCPLKGKSTATSIDKRLLCSGRGDDTLALDSQLKNLETQGERATRGDRMSEQGLFSCVTCGVLCFACVAIIQPTDAAAKYLITADSSIFKDWEETCDALASNTIGDNENVAESVSFSGWMNKRNRDGLFDVPVQSADQIESMDEECGGPDSNTVANEGTSSLGLLALTYGNSSDSEEEEVEADMHVEACQRKSVDCLPESGLDCENAGSAFEGAALCHDISRSDIGCANEIPLQIIQPWVEPGLTKDRSECMSHQSLNCPAEYKTNFTSLDSHGLIDMSRHEMKLQHIASNCSPVTPQAETTMTTALVPFENTPSSFPSRSDEDSSRMHVFCLQHAVQVEKQLRSIGGAHVFLLCHPDYPKVEAQAKKVAEELGSDSAWRDISFREASKEEKETIKLALESEQAIHGNGDWAVKLGINLYYSANLSRSPLYCKQMPYNFVIYDAFGRTSPVNSPTKPEFNGKGPGKQKKMFVAGKWCGKIWMSNQVHPFLAERGQEEEQEKSIPSRVKPDVKPERPSENTQTSEIASIACRTGRKRKNRAEIRPVIKIKSPKTEEQDKAFEDSLLTCSLQQCKSTLRNKGMKKETPDPHNKFLRNKKQFNSDVEHEPEPEPRNNCAKKKKRSNLGTEDEPEPQNKCARNKKKSHLDNEDEPEPQNNRARNKKRLEVKDEPEGGPSTRLRKRASKPSKDQGAKSVEAKTVSKKQQNDGKAKKGSAGCNNMKVRDEKADFPCDMEGCTMSFGSKKELALHKRNICPVKGCGKKFFSHKYLVQHRRVHMDDRPLKCPWKGCKMTFKWAWARTEHIRVHTGARPYVCAEAGCGQTFRFVSDFSRHKRKTGHSSKKGRG